MGERDMVVVSSGGLKGGEEGGVSMFVDMIW